MKIETLGFTQREYRLERGPIYSKRNPAASHTCKTSSLRREPCREPHGPFRARPAHLLYLARWSSIPPMSGLFFWASRVAK